ncbi:dynamin family protein [Actinomadura formosensis]|uniref:dynamin family protein n=1 Tax=Actinomadura formosensis TaxID=60706 RepID=UPI003D940E8B
MRALTASAIRAKGERAIAEALRDLPKGRACDAIRGVLEEEGAALGGAMGVAVTGIVSSGKSTLVNALIGGDLLATGYHAMTFVSAVLRYAEALEILESGKPITRDELLARSGRKADGSHADTSGFEVRGPWPYLRWFDLVDTPGFDSAFDEDTVQAMAAFGLTAEKIRERTFSDLVRADAVVTVLNHANLSQEEAAMLSRFHTGEDDRPPLSPVTCLGVLTKLEDQWRPADPELDPLAVGERHVRRLMAQPEAARLFYKVVPVCSMVGATAATLTEEDFTDLVSLTDAPPETVLSALKSRAHFARADLPVAADRRAALLARFTPYGVHLACGLLRNGATTPAALREELDRRSGLPGLRSLLVRHFGRRRDLIKVARVVARAHALTAGLPGDPRDRRAAQVALRHVTDLARDDQDLIELDLLARWYEGKLTLPDGIAEEFRRAAGEEGTSVAERLGLAPGTPLADLEKAACARLGVWRASPLLSPDAVPIVQVLERRYELLCDRVRTARSLLEDGP